MLKKEFPPELLHCVTAVSKPTFPVENVADYVACTNQGYLIEIKGNMIVQSLDISVTDAVDLFCFYKWIGCDCTCHYILRGVSGTLVAVRKQGKSLKVVERREGIRSVRLQDLENSGQPQIIVNGNLNDSNNAPQILTITENDAVFDMEYLDLNLQSMSQSLSKKLQEMQEHYNGLEKEVRMKNWFIEEHLEGSCHGGLEETLTPLKDTEGGGKGATPMVTPPPLVINKCISRVVSPFWLILIEVENNSDCCIRDLEILPFSYYGDEIMFHIDSGTGITDQILPFTKSFIATRLPVFEKENGFCEFEIRYENHILKTPKFTLMAKQIAFGSYDLFQDSQNIDIDMIFLRATHSQYTCDLKLTAPVLANFNKMLQSELGLRELSTCRRASYYHGKTSALQGLFITLQNLDNLTQQIQIYSINAVQFDIFMTALKNCLPEETPFDVKICYNQQSSQ